MSALKFLSKKSWHTATIRNNEKVWLREQEAEREKTRIDELQKQLAEERRQEEIQKLEEANGLTDGAAANRRQRLTWMYEYTKPKDSPNGDNTKNPAANSAGPSDAMREDVLLGRRPVDQEVTKQLSAPAREISAQLVDAEAKLREDPLVAVQLARARAVASQNPAASLRGIEKQRRSVEAAKRARERALRKQERRHIREARKIRRDERAQRTSSARRDLN